MAAIAWPGSLPVYPRYGWQQPFGNNTIVTQTDSGPKKRRRRYSAAAPRVFTGQFVFTKAQFATFDTFYETTTKGGSLAFDFTDPVDDTTKDYAFEAPPTVVETHEDVFVVSVQLERAI